MDIPIEEARKLITPVYEAQVDTVAAQLAVMERSFNALDKAGRIGADIVGFPEALGKFAIQGGKGEGGWLPVLEKAIESAMGQLVLANVDDFAAMAHDLIRGGATSRETAAENNLADGLSYARGNLPRYIDEAEAAAALEEKYPGITQDLITSGENEDVPSFDFLDATQDEDCPPGKQYLQRFELELWVAGQSYAYHYRLEPTSLGVGQPTWKYQARALSREDFDAGKGGDFDTHHEGYCGDSDYGLAPGIKNGFFYASNFRRAFDAIFYAAQTHKENGPGT